MPSRRHFIQGSASLLALAATPWLPSLAYADPSQLLKRAIPSSGELLPVIGLGTARTFDVSPSDDNLNALDAVMRTFINGRERGMAQFEASLQALQTDTLDLVQVHNLQDTYTQLALLRELKAEGKVRYIGITHYIESAHDDLLEVLGKESVDFVQLNYSVGERNAEKRLLPYCADHGIATLINRPFQRGQLLGRVKGKPLPNWAMETDATSWAQLLLKFILANPAVTAVIPATSNPRYMADNLKAGIGRLPDAALREKIVQAFS